MTIRSIDTVLDDRPEKEGLPILTKDLTDEDAVKYGIKKEEVELTLAGEIHSKTQTQFIDESNLNEVVKTPTLIRNEPDFLFPVNAFRFFFKCLTGLAY